VIDVIDEASVAASFSMLDTFDHLVFTAGDWFPNIFSNPVAAMDFAITMGEGLKVRFWGSLMERCANGIGAPGEEEYPCVCERPLT